MCGCQHKKYNATTLASHFKDGGFVSELSVSDKAKYFTYLDENKNDPTFWDADSDDDAFGKLKSEFDLDYTQSLSVLDAWMRSRGLKFDGGVLGSGELDEEGLDAELEAFDLSNLDMLEERTYSDAVISFDKHKEVNNNLIRYSSKVEALKLLINNTEGDFSQLSPHLAEIAYEYYPEGYFDRDDYRNSDEYKKEFRERNDDDEYRDGGTIDAKRRFTDSDFQKLVGEDSGFGANRNGIVWSIVKVGGGRILGHYNPDKEYIYVLGKKNLSNPLVKWLSENSYTTNDEFYKLADGGSVIAPSRYDFKRKNGDGEITELYIEYEFKPTKGQVLADLKSVKSRFREDSEYANFSPIVVIVYPYTYGWTRGYKAYFSSDKNFDVDRLFYDETKGARSIFYLDYYVKGGIVVSKLSDIPNIQKRVDDGDVTYRGLGMGKLSDDFYEIAGGGGVRIKIDKKEYFITDADFKKLNWDFKNSKWLNKIKFDAPFRKFKKGGKVENQGYQVFNYTDNIYASPDIFKKRKEAKDFIAEFRQRYETQGYYRDNRMNKISPAHIDLEIIPENFSPVTGEYMANGGGVGEVYTDDDGIKYQVGQKAGGVWTIFSSSDNWTERDEFESGFANEQDAILVAKEMAGLTPEFADGGSITKVYNFPDFGVKSFKNLIDEGVFVSKHRTKRNAMEYNRIKFNRMDYAQQAEYDKKLNKEKITYDLQLSDVNGGGTYQVSKQVYDYANIPETEEKSYYIKYERGGDVSDLVFSTRKLVKSKETKVKHNLINGEIDMNKLKSIIGYEPEYPTQFVGSIKLTKCFMRPFYKI